MQIQSEPARPMVRPPSWTEHAKCSQQANNDWQNIDKLFFPAVETPIKREAVNAFCTGCKVRNLCRDLKQQTKSVGFWGETP